jgi:hypothetical protein
VGFISGLSVREFLPEFISDFLSNRESFSQKLSDNVIGLYFGSIKYRPYFYDIRQTILSEQRLFHFNIHDLADEVCVTADLAGAE